MKKTGDSLNGKSFILWKIPWSKTRGTKFRCCSFSTSSLAASPGLVCLANIMSAWSRGHPIVANHQDVKMGQVGVGMNLDLYQSYIIYLGSWSSTKITDDLYVEGFHLCQVHGAVEIQLVSLCLENPMNSWFMKLRKYLVTSSKSFR